jgi:hypothetical protein
MRHVCFLLPILKASMPSIYGYLWFPEGNPAAGADAGAVIPP